MKTNVDLRNHFDVPVSVSLRASVLSSEADSRAMLTSPCRHLQVFWEHEQFSRRRMVAGTLSGRPAPPEFLEDTGGIADTRARVDPAAVAKAVKFVAESLAVSSKVSFVLLRRFLLKTDSSQISAKGFAGIRTMAKRCFACVCGSKSQRFHKSCPSVSNFKRRFIRRRSASESSFQLHSLTSRDPHGQALDATPTSTLC